MIRLIFLIAVLMTLPTVGYILWRVYASTKRGGTGEDAFDWDTMPWQWLAIAGLACTIIGLAFFVTGEVTNPGDAYRPPIPDPGPLPGTGQAN